MEGLFVGFEGLCRYGSSLFLSAVTAMTVFIFFWHMSDVMMHVFNLNTN